MANPGLEALHVWNLPPRLIEDPSDRPTDVMVGTYGYHVRTEELYIWNGTDWARLTRSAFTRDVKFKAAWDKRAEGHGVHGVQIVFTLGGAYGAVVLNVWTPWYLPLSQGHHAATEVTVPPLQLHSRKPQQHPWKAHEGCSVLGRLCFRRLVSFSRTGKLWDKLIEEGSDGLWAEMARIYEETL
jgi:hypothetical protein